MMTDPGAFTIGTDPQCTAAPILYVAVEGLYVACSKVNSGSVAKEL